MAGGHSTAISPAKIFPVPSSRKARVRSSITEKSTVLFPSAVKSSSPVSTVVRHTVSITSVSFIRRETRISMHPRPPAMGSSTVGIIHQEGI